MGAGRIPDVNDQLGLNAFEFTASTGELTPDGRIVRAVPFDSPEPLDTAIGPDGHDLLVGVQFDGPSGGGNLMVADVTTGEATTLIGESEGDGYPRTGTILSASAWKVPGGSRWA